MIHRTSHHLSAICRCQVGVCEEEGLRHPATAADQETQPGDGAQARGKGCRPQESVARHGSHEHLSQHGRRKKHESLLFMISGVFAVVTDFFLLCCNILGQAMVGLSRLVRICVQGCKMKGCYRRASFPPFFALLPWLSALRHGPMGLDR